MDDVYFIDPITPVDVLEPETDSAYREASMRLVSHHNQTLKYIATSSNPGLAAWVVIYAYGNALAETQNMSQTAKMYGVTRAWVSKSVAAYKRKNGLTLGGFNCHSNEEKRKCRQSRIRHATKRQKQHGKTTNN